MYSFLFKSPAQFSKRVAELVLQRLFQRYNLGAAATEGELLTRILDTLRTFFSKVRRSLISSQSFVTPMEGPSSSKMNDLMTTMMDDVTNAYSQQNAIDASIVEIHNLTQVQKDSIEIDLKKASEKLDGIIVLSSNLEAGVIIFEDKFTTSEKQDKEFPTTRGHADIDTSANVLRLANNVESIGSDLVDHRNVRVIFNQDIPLDDNTFSYGKLYGDPRDLGENGIRARFSVTKVSEGNDVTVNESNDDGDSSDDDNVIKGRPPARG